METQASQPGELGRTNGGRQQHTQSGEKSTAEPGGPCEAVQQGGLDPVLPEPNRPWLAISLSQRVRIQQPRVTRPLAHWSTLGLCAGRADSSLRGGDLFPLRLSPPPHSSLTAKTWENKLGHPASWERYSDLPHVVFQN